MGLDMNVYRVHKPLLDESKLYDRGELDGIVINESKITDPRVQQLIPYCTKIRAIDHYYNIEEIGKDYGLTDVHIGGFHYGTDGSYSTIYGHDKDGMAHSVSVQDELIDSKHTIDREESFFVCMSDEIRYWRKAYDIQQWFHDNIPEPVENTGYYVLNEQLLREFNEAFPDRKLPVEAPNENCAIVYWEWY